MVYGCSCKWDFESVYHCFESNHENDNVSFVAGTSQGYCFGEKQGNINIVKTIIPKDMLFESQKKVFNALKFEFDAFNKERYGTDI